MRKVLSLIITIFSIQTTLSMETCSFKSLPFDVQRTIFQYIPNKYTFRGINKEFATTWSVQFPGIFSNDLCGLDKPHMIRILLNAAYKKNYDGVENILAKSSLLQQCPDKYLHYCFDTNEKGREKIIEIYRLSTKYYQANKEFTYKRDEKLYLLLKKYGVQKPHIFDVALWTAVVNKNIMACLAGDSDAITKKDNASFIKKQRIKIAFEVAVSCNNIKCIKKCLEIAQAYKDDHCVHDVFAVNPECVALENEYTKLFDEMYAIIQKYPHLHVIIDDWKDKTAITTLKKLDQERQMTFLELVCTIC